MLRRGAATVLAAGLALAGCGGSSGPKLLGTGRPASYRITYQTKTTGPIAFQVLTARRPFDVRSATFAAPPHPGDTPTGGTLTNFDHLFVVRADGPHTVSGRQPAVGTADQALAPVMPEAVDRKLAKALGVRTVAGRRCRDYRFLEPPAGPLKALGKSDNDVLCIDADGLVLREAYTFQGKVALVRTATSVEIDPAGIDAELDTSKAVAVADPSTPTATPTPDATSFIKPGPPAGFTAAPITTFRLPTPGGNGVELLYTSVVWPFTRGADLITVEAGDSPQLPWDANDPSRPVTVPLGKGASVLRSDGSELRFDLGNARCVRVRGTVPFAPLETYAKTLRVTG